MDNAARKISLRVGSRKSPTLDAINDGMPLDDEALPPAMVRLMLDLSQEPKLPDDSGTRGNLAEEILAATTDSSPVQR